jgi:UDP-N-acetylmuramoyl-tripeptide--D-alanyl-D-alanine ligase
MKFLSGILRILGRLTIWRYEPKIIGITGSVGKTSAKVAIATVLGKEHRVRIASGNLNNDLGMPLTILGDWTPEELKLVSRDTPRGTATFRKLFFWIKVLSVSAYRVVVKAPDYPEVLILEYGADRPGDIKYLLRIARPSIGIITAVGDVPVHVEFYAGPQEVAREKGRLIDGIPTTGFAILGADDDTVMRLKDRTRAKVITYGFHQGADLRIVRFENHIEEARPIGISFKIEYGGSFVPVRINGVFGKTHALAAGAAATVGLIFGMNLVKISEALESYVPAGSRMELVPGVKHTLVIDDAYNASPLSMRAALETLKDLPAERKVAVLGDMLEIGKYTTEAHEQIGHLAGEIVDVLVTVGARAKFIVEGAKEIGMKKSNIYSFDTAEEAIEPLKDHLKKGDLVLVKGSHAMELDKIVAEIKEFAIPAEAGIQDS